MLPAHLQPLRWANCACAQNVALCVLLNHAAVYKDHVLGRPHVASSEAAGESWPTRPASEQLAMDDEASGERSGEGDDNAVQHCAAPQGEVRASFAVACALQVCGVLNNEQNISKGSSLNSGRSWRVVRFNHAHPCLIGTRALLVDASCWWMLPVGGRCIVASARRRRRPSAASLPCDSRSRATGCQGWSQRAQWPPARSSSVGPVCSPPRPRCP